MIETNLFYSLISAYTTQKSSIISITKPFYHFSFDPVSEDFLISHLCDLKMEFNSQVNDVLVEPLNSLL